MILFVADPYLMIGFTMSFIRRRKKVVLESGVIIKFMIRALRRMMMKILVFDCDYNV